jgi:hypothetical protein
LFAGRGCRDPSASRRKRRGTPVGITTKEKARARARARAEGLRRPTLQRPERTEIRKQATAEAKMRKGRERKRKDGKSQELGKAKQDGGVNPPICRRREEKAPASENGCNTTQEPTHKDSMWGPWEKKIGPRTDRKVATTKTQEGVRFERQRAPGI